MSTLEQRAPYSAPSDSALSEGFKVNRGTVNDWFTPDVKRTINEYSLGTRDFTPIEELIILNRMNQGLHMEQLGGCRY